MQRIHKYSQNLSSLSNNTAPKYYASYSFNKSILTLIQTKTNLLAIYHHR